MDQTDPLRSRPARHTPESRQTAGTPELRLKRRFARADEAIDAETLEVVQTFEALYSELVPPAETHTTDELADDFRFGVGEDVRSAPLRAQHATSVAATPRPRVQGKFPVAQPSRAATEPVARSEDLNIEDAFAMLRAAEAQGPGALERSEREAFVAEHRRAEAGVPRKPDVASATPVVRTWSSASRQSARGNIIAAAGLALVMGAGAGYIAGKKPGSSAPHARIETSAQGGAQLRFDYNLEPAGGPPGR